MAISRTEARDIVVQLLSAAIACPPSEISDDDDLRMRLHLDDSHLNALVTQINQRHWRGVVLLPAELRGCRTVRDVIDLVWKQANRMRRSARGPRVETASRADGSATADPADATGVARIDRRGVRIDVSGGAIVGADLEGDNNRVDGSPVPSRRRELDQGDYLVWYGTNRPPRDRADLQKGYSAERDRSVHFGTCRVYVPKSHKIGSLGSPWWNRLLTFTDDRLKLLETVEVARATFWRQVSAQLASVAATERRAVIFVHGYNVSFDNAALRAAQIGFDLSIKGAMAFFSWPSQGNVRGYTIDEATIEASEGAITDFMVDFAIKSGANAVHIIAHSMGNRGVLRAVNRIAQRAQRRSQVTFGQVILAAADVDADTFRQLCAAYARVAARTTMYVSARDIAVEAARWLHGFPRAGIVPPVCIVPGIDTINVTNADLSLLGHSYVAEARDVLQDMHRLLVSGDSPEQRFGLKEKRTETGERFWLIGR
jgi:esterase/lipase superfamily enzyme